MLLIFNIISGFFASPKIDTEKHEVMNESLTSKTLDFLANVSQLKDEVVFYKSRNAEFLDCLIEKIEKNDGSNILKELRQVKEELFHIHKNFKRRKSAELNFVDVIVNENDIKSVRDFLSYNQGQLKNILLKFSDILGSQTLAFDQIRKDYFDGSTESEPSILESLIDRRGKMKKEFTQAYDDVSNFYKEATVSYFRDMLSLMCDESEKRTTPHELFLQNFSKDLPNTLGRNAPFDTCDYELLMTESSASLKIIEECRKILFNSRNFVGVSESIKEIFESLLSKLYNLKCNEDEFGIQQRVDEFSSEITKELKIKDLLECLSERKYKINHYQRCVDNFKRLIEKEIDKLKKNVFEFSGSAESIYKPNSEFLIGALISFSESINSVIKGFLDRISIAFSQEMNLFLKTSRSYDGQSYDTYVSKHLSEKVSLISHFSLAYSTLGMNRGVFADTKLNKTQYEALEKCTDGLENDALETFLLFKEVCAIFKRYKLSDGAFSLLTLSREIFNKIFKDSKINVSTPEGFKFISTQLRDLFNPDFSKNAKRKLKNNNPMLFSTTSNKQTKASVNNRKYVEEYKKHKEEDLGNVWFFFRYFLLIKNDERRLQIADTHFKKSLNDDSMAKNEFHSTPFPSKRHHFTEALSEINLKDPGMLSESVKDAVPPQKSIESIQSDISTSSGPINKPSESKTIAQAENGEFQKQKPSEESKDQEDSKTDLPKIQKPDNGSDQNISDKKSVNDKICPDKISERKGPKDKPVKISKTEKNGDDKAQEACPKKEQDNESIQSYATDAKKPADETDNSENTSKDKPSAQPDNIKGHSDAFKNEVKSENTANVAQNSAIDKQGEKLGDLPQKNIEDQKPTKHGTPIYKSPEEKAENTQKSMGLPDTESEINTLDSAAQPSTIEKSDQKVENNTQVAKSDADEPIKEQTNDQKANNSQINAQKSIDKHQIEASVDRSRNTSKTATILRPHGSVASEDSSRDIKKEDLKNAGKSIENNDEIKSAVSTESKEDLTNASDNVTTGLQNEDTKDNVETNTENDSKSLDTAVGKVEGEEKKTKKGSNSTNKPLSPTSSTKEQKSDEDACKNLKEKILTESNEIPRSNISTQEGVITTKEENEADQKGLNVNPKEEESPKNSVKVDTGVDDHEKTTITDVSIDKSRVDNKDPQGAGQECVPEETQLKTEERDENAVVAAPKTPLETKIHESKISESPDDTKNQHAAAANPNSEESPNVDVRKSKSSKEHVNQEGQQATQTEQIQSAPIKKQTDSSANDASNSTMGKIWIIVLILALIIVTGAGIFFGIRIYDAYGS